MISPLRHHLLEALVILLLGATCGLAVNHRLVIAAFAGRLTPPVAAALTPLAAAPVPVPVALAELQQLLAQGALALDARPHELYLQGHLPGALSLPLEELPDGTTLPAGRLPQGTTLITYCSGYGCADSYDLAGWLLQAGYGDVRVFEGGFPAWSDAGLPVVVGQP